MRKFAKPPPNLQANCFVEAGSQENLASTMVFGKTWMPKNATVHATGNITKSLLSPSSASNQSEVFHGQGAARNQKSPMAQNNLTSYKKVQ